MTSHGLVFTTRGSRLDNSVCSSSLSVQEDLTGEQASIQFLVIVKGQSVPWFAS